MLWSFNRKIVLDALRQLTLLSGTLNKDTGRDSPDKVTVGDQINSELETENAFRTPLTGTLSIQTSPVPSSYSCSTDTASESGSAFNSPNQVHQIQLQHHPSSADLANSTYVKDFSRLVVVKMSGQSAELQSVDGITFGIS